MFVGCPIPQIMDVKLKRAILLRPFHNAFAQRRPADFWKQGNDVDTHCKELKLVGAIDSENFRELTQSSARQRRLKRQLNNSTARARGGLLDDFECGSLTVARCGTGE